jgi:hypothetical protein
MPSRDRMTPRCRPSPSPSSSTGTPRAPDIPGSHCWATSRRAWWRRWRCCLNTRLATKRIVSTGDVLLQPLLAVSNRCFDQLTASGRRVAGGGSGGAAPRGAVRGHRHRAGGHAHGRLECSSPEVSMATEFVAGSVLEKPLQSLTDLLLIYTPSAPLEPGSHHRCQDLQRLASAIPRRLGMYHLRSPIPTSPSSRKERAQSSQGSAKPQPPLHAGRGVSKPAAVHPGPHVPGRVPLPVPEVHRAREPPVPGRRAQPPPRPPWHRRRGTGSSGTFHWSPTPPCPRSWSWSPRRTTTSTTSPPAPSSQDPPAGGAPCRLVDFHL